MPVVRPTHHQRGANASSFERARALRKKKPYKIVLEAVTQEKKKLQSVMTYRADAPSGYTFVPLGNREITEYCKEKCRKQNLTAHIVSAKPKGKAPSEPKNDAEEVRIDTQRIGHHFPNAIVDEACEYLGYDRYDTKRGKFLKSRDFEHSRLAQSLRDYGQRMQLHGRPATETQTKEQIRSAILEVFPKIPEKDLTAIVGHAFEQGTNRVGNAKDLTLARRVQLAVGAYIRHQYTDYDTILKTGGSWHEARQKAQPISYAKLAEWRDEGDSSELEETFREIIVLDDDEDDMESSSSDDTLSDGGERAGSLEIVSSRATARELQPESNTDAAGSAQGWRLIPEARPPRFMHRPQHHAIAESGRYSMRSGRQADLRLAPGHLPAPRPYERDPYYPSYIPAQAYEPSHPDISVPLTGPNQSNPVTSQVTPVTPRSPSFFYGRDGKLYNLQPIAEPRARPQAVEYVPLRTSSQHHIRDGYVQAPSNPRLVNYHPDRSAPAPMPISQRPPREDDVIPSIEREAQADSISSPRHQNKFQLTRGYDSSPEPGNHHSMRRDDMQSSKRAALPAPVNSHYDDYYDQRSKRIRPLYYGSAPSRHTEASMFHRMHTRNPSENMPRSRVPPNSHAIDLTSSPHKPSAAERGPFAAPSSSYMVAGSSSRSHVSQPPYEYAPRRPEPRAPERHVLHRYEGVVGPREYVRLH